MKLKLVAAISALAIPALAHAQQDGPQPKVPKPTKADAQNVVQIVTSDKVKTQAYCDFTKLENQVKVAEQKNDTKTLEALSRQAESLLDKLGPEYFFARKSRGGDRRRNCSRAMRRTGSQFRLIHSLRP